MTKSTLSRPRLQRVPMGREAFWLVVAPDGATLGYVAKYRNTRTTFHGWRATLGVGLTARFAGHYATRADAVARVVAGEDGAFRGNESTGDLRPLARFLADLRCLDGNWVEGYAVDGWRVQLQVFADPSKYGIDGGRISRLSIIDGSPQCRSLCHYDRGWDLLPVGDAGILVDTLREIL